MGSDTKIAANKIEHQDFKNGLEKTRYMAHNHQGGKFALDTLRY